MGKTKCSVKGCNYGPMDTKKGEKRQMFQFPENEDLYKIWCEKVSRNYTAPASTRVVCDKHFSSKCFSRNYKTMTKSLRPDAVPDLFLYQPKPKELE